jgi:hypothetical protein
VYDYVNGNFSSAVELDNLGGVFIGDRSNPDPYKKWVPRPDLMLYIPPPAEFNSTLTNETNWMLYAGNWGAPLQLPEVSLDCLNANQTERYPCPNNNESTRLILQILKLASGLPFGLNLGGVGDTYTGAGSSNSTLIGYPGITGPLNRGYSETWIARPLPLIQNKNATTLICPEDTNQGTPLPNLDPAVFNVSVSTLTNYLIGVAIGDVVFSVLLVLVMALPTLLDKSAKVHKMVVKKAQYLAGEAGAVAKKATNAMENMLPGTAGSAIEAARLQAVADEKAALAIAVADVEAVEADVEAVEDVILRDEESGHASTIKKVETLLLPAEAAIVNAADVAKAAGISPSPSSASLKSTEIINVQLDNDARHSFRTFVWFVLGLCLFIAGIIVSTYGVVATLNDSVVAAALARFNAGSVAATLEFLLIAGLALIGGFDIIVVRFNLLIVKIIKTKLSSAFFSVKLKSSLLIFFVFLLCRSFYSFSCVLNASISVDSPFVTTLEASAGATPTFLSSMSSHSALLFSLSASLFSSLHSDLCLL